MSEISQFHDLAELCKKMDNPVSMSADSIIAISAECDTLHADLQIAMEAIYKAISYGNRLDIYKVLNEALRKIGKKNVDN